MWSLPCPKPIDVHNCYSNLPWPHEPNSTIKYIGMVPIFADHKRLFYKSSCVCFSMTLINSLTEVEVEKLRLPLVSILSPLSQQFEKRMYCSNQRTMYLVYQGWISLIAVEELSQILSKFISVLPYLEVEGT